MSGVEPAGDGRDVELRPIFEGEGRSARDHAHRVGLCQQIQDLFGEAIGEVRLILLLAHVHERQHGHGKHRPVGRSAGRRRGRRAHQKSGRACDDDERGGKWCTQGAKAEPGKSTAG